MAQLALRNLSGEDLGMLEVRDDVFDAPVNDALVHQAVVQLHANRRRGSHKTKTRGEVAGGSAKPWRQKGTGRARHGSRVSPLWRGGGTTFGPTPRSYRQDMPRKMRRGALRSGLTSRLQEGAILALDDFSPPSSRTADMERAMEGLGLDGTVLIVDERFGDNAHLASRNLQRISLQDCDSVNLLDVLEPEHLVFTTAALRRLEGRLSRSVPDASVDETT